MYYVVHMIIKNNIEQMKSIMESLVFEEGQINQLLYSKNFKHANRSISGINLHENAVWKPIYKNYIQVCIVDSIITTVHAMV